MTSLRQGAAYHIAALRGALGITAKFDGRWSFSPISVHSPDVGYYAESDRRVTQ
jgi:hypothetical protein